MTDHEANLKLIDAMFEKYGTDGAMFSVSELDGFLTSIVSGPDMIMPSQWLPEIWGGADQMPQWETEKEAKRFLQAVMAMMDETAITLFEYPEDFEALFLVDNSGDEPVDEVSLWCIGYMRAVSMRAESWQALPDFMEQHLGCIAMFGTDLGAEALEHLTKEEVAQRKKEIDPAARAIHAYWLAQREALSPSKKRLKHAMHQAQVAPYVREQPKIGPNTPCPCGSGKKYKKCCGAN